MKSKLEKSLSDAEDAIHNEIALAIKAVIHKHGGYVNDQDWYRLLDKVYALVDVSPSVKP